MGKLSLKLYVSKCVIGGEIVYTLCLLGGLSPMRSAEISQLYHSLFELMPGFVWISMGSFIIGAVYTLIFSVLFGSYMVWMYNSSVTKKK
ncbi:hypothetical protein D4R99_03060 [bacterium]|nr:MAG: hypothetical protein D4R99_03060 [bacterium]